MSVETSNQEDFQYFTESFADVKILRYRIPGFQDLPLERKKLLYFLYEASLCGRDIIWDQNYKHNLLIRRTLEAMVQSYQGDRTSESFEQLLDYTKRVWFSNGIHHHYSSAKFTPEIDFETFANIARNCPDGNFPLKQGQTLDDLLDFLKPILFDSSVDNKKVNKGRDLDRVANSAVNYYEDVTEAEVNAFYEQLSDPNDKTPISHGLNSRLEKRDGKLVEVPWKVGGLYGEALAPMVQWLEKAVEAAENPTQKTVLSKLVQFYKTGNLEDFDDYSIAWVQDIQSDVDMIHGFIESYNDPMGYRGSYEAMLSVKDPVATKRIQTIASEANWFEAHSPTAPEHKKEEVKGVAGSVINVIVAAGDASPACAIGVNLPNADWIREQHGSKSVNLANVVTAYRRGSGDLHEAFIYSEEELACYHTYEDLSDDLHTDLHEVIGHGSGKLCPGVATPKETLKHYQSTIEEARADLVALYFMMDPHLIELGLMPSLDAGKASYDGFIRNGLLVQLRRLEPGEDLEEDHMRNRQLIAAWAYEKGAPEGVIEKKIKDGKTYFVVNDYQKLRDLFGQLLKLVQRIKSEGDFEAAEALVETYGVKVDRQLHLEVLERFKALNLAPYSGLINPKLEPVYENGTLVDVTVSYPTCFQSQMMDYAENYGFLARVI